MEVYSLLTSVAFTLVLAVAFTLVLAACDGQFVPERTESCGSLISSVIAVCSQPEMSRPDWCCNELTKWNNARCWCEPHAFDALDSVAASGSAYSFRDGFCPASFYRPGRGIIEDHFATCEAFASVDASDDTEPCDGVAPSTLRTEREQALNSLNQAELTTATSLDPWINSLQALFTEEAVYENVGLFRGQGRTEVLQYFVTRQATYGFMPNTVTRRQETAFWRNPSMVSYYANSTGSDGVSYARREFVTFEQCTARIAAVYVVDENYQQRYQQFWQPSSTVLLARYSQTARQWCADVSSRCTGEQFPFNSVADCNNYHAELTKSGQVTCNGFKTTYVPQYALHGNTLACRSFYLDLAAAVPQIGCTGVGRNSSKDRCDASQCPGNAYINPFGADAGAMQFETNAEFICSTTQCVERWPSRQMYESIPEGDRANYPAWGSFASTDSEGVEETMPDTSTAAMAMPATPVPTSSTPAPTPQPTAAPSPETTISTAPTTATAGQGQVVIGGSPSGGAIDNNEPAANAGASFTVGSAV